MTQPFRVGAHVFARIGARVFVRAFPTALLLAATSCSGGGSTDPDEPGPPASLALRTQPSGATVGVPFAVPPVVEVRDAEGRLVTSPSVTITVSLATGDGTLGGLVTRTSAQGIASFPDLEIVGAVGPRSLAFSAPGLAGATSGSFALGAGPANRVEIVQAPTVAETGTPLAEQPVVRLRDEGDNVVGAGVVVTAAIAEGNGVVLSGGTASTNAQGIAAFTTLTLGALNGSAGDIRLELRAPGGASASATLPLLCYLRLLEAGTPQTTALRVGDCAFADGARFHNYVVRGDQALNAFTLALSSTYPGPGLYFLFLGDESFTWFFGLDAAAGQSQVSYGMLFPQGEVVLRPTSLTPTTGSYTISSTVSAENVTGCPPTWIAGPLVTSQAIATTDCTSDGSFHWDNFLFGLAPGTTARITMTAAGYSPRLVLWESGATNWIQLDDVSGAGSDVTVARNRGGSTGQTYLVQPGAAGLGLTGPYTLTVEIGATAAATSATAVPSASAATSGSAWPSASAAPAFPAFRGRALPAMPPRPAERPR